jgi:hypothetical protein
MRGARRRSRASNPSGLAPGFSLSRRCRCSGSVTAVYRQLVCRYLWHTSHSPQPLGWGSGAPYAARNHFNGLPQLAIPSSTAKLNLSFSPTFRLGFRSGYTALNHLNGFKNNPHTKGDPHMSTHSLPIKRNIIASGLIRRSTPCLLSGMAWNGELRETIKMVPRSIRRPRSPT